MPTAKEKAYIAGFVDGEGHIGIHSWKKGVNTNRSIRVILVNTDPSVLEWVQSIYGGSLSSREYQSNWKLRWDLTLTTHKALAFLEDIRPFLRMKRRQADTCILFQKGRNRSRKNIDRFWDGVLVEALHSLNKRGKDVSDSSRQINQAKF